MLAQCTSKNEERLVPGQFVDFQNVPKLDWWKPKLDWWKHKLAALKCHPSAEEKGNLDKRRCERIFCEKKGDRKDPYDRTRITVT